MPIFDKKWSDDGLELALDVQNYYQVAYKTIQKAFSWPKIDKNVSEQFSHIKALNMDTVPNDKVNQMIQMNQTLKKHSQFHLWTCDRRWFVYLFILGTYPFGCIYFFHKITYFI